MKLRSLSRLHLLMLTVVLAMPLMPITLASPAAAATSCTVVDGGDVGGGRRFCQVNTSYSGGAKVNGTISWNFKSNAPGANPQKGVLNLALEDTASNGSCAWIKITPPRVTDTDAKWFSDCGNNNQAVRVTTNLNSANGGGFIDLVRGTIKVKVCDSQADCKQVFRQRIQKRVD